MNFPPHNFLSSPSSTKCCFRPRGSPNFRRVCGGRGRTYLLLALVIQPLATHPSRDGAPFRFLMETPPTFGRYFNHHFYFPAQLVGGFYPQRSSGQAVVVTGLPPRCVPLFLLRIGFSIPTARRFLIGGGQLTLSRFPLVSLI